MFFRYICFILVCFYVVKSQVEEPIDVPIEIPIEPDFKPFIPKPFRPPQSIFTCPSCYREVCHCDPIYCPRCYQCVNGDCQRLKGCCGKICPPCYNCINNACVKDPHCCGDKICAPCYVCEKGNCIPIPGCREPLIPIPEPEKKNVSNGILA